MLRLVIGRGWGQGPEHSQVLENIFSSIPGLKVVMPAFPSDAKGMIISENKRKNEISFYSNSSTSSKSTLMHFFIERYKDAYKNQLYDFDSQSASK